MKQFDLKLGFACNNKCIHCVITDKIKFGQVPLNKIKNIVSNIGPDVSRITLTGGEPTIRPDIVEIVKFIKFKRPDLSITMQTNGRALANIKLAQQLSEGIDVFFIAIHSHNAFIHDAISGVSGSFEQTSLGIKNILTIGSEVITQTVISKLNCDGLVKTYDFIFTEFAGVKRMGFTFPHPNGNAWTNFNQVVPKYSSIKKVIHEVMRKYKGRLNFESIPLCYLHPNIDVRRKEEILESVESSGYDQSHESTNGYVSDYNNLDYLEKVKIPSCKECIYNDRCTGVWKEYYIKYKDEMDLIPIRK